MKKINTRMIFMQCVFLMVVIGGSIILYNLLGPSLYRNYRINEAKEAFETLKDIDLGDIGEDKEFIQNYENANFNFIIADEYMKRVYSTQDMVDIYKNIQIRQNDFSNPPLVIIKKNQRNENIRLLGLLKQGDHTYYVNIKDRLKSVSDSFEFSVVILEGIFSVSLVIGSIVMYYMSNRLSKPIKELEVIAKKIAKRNFCQKAEEKGKFEELNSLACSINSMSEQIQTYIQDMEINKEKMLQQRLQQEHMTKARKDFVSNISHELKTPLAVISSQVEMLEYLTEKSEREYYYTSIQEEITKMSDMVGNLLDITAIEYNMGRVEKKKLLLNDVVGYMLLKYDALFQRKNISVETELEGECNIWADKEYIEQAVSNYIMNAIQHTDKGKRIKITLKKSAQDICFKVYNQGEQIPQEELDNIWKSFYVAEQERKGENGMSHTGLGLNIVKSVMEMHEGKCGVRNLENGVEFWFRLPIQSLEETK